ALSLPSIATAPTAWQPPSAHWPPSSPDPADGQMGLTLAAHRVAVGAIRAGPGCTGALPRHLLDFSGQRRRPLTPTPGSTIPTLRAESGRTHPMPSLVGPGGRSRHCCRLASASPRPVSRSPTVLHLFGPAEEFGELHGLARLGAESPRPIPETLVGGRGEHAKIRARALVVEGHEGCLQPATTDPPGDAPLLDVVVPGEFPVDLVQVPIEHQGVLAHAGAGGPLAADLQPDHPPGAPSGSGTPVPSHVIGPPAAAVVQHRPRL